MELGLSGRQIELLHWLAEGKTAAEIAVIVGTTRRMVSFHIEKAIKSLDCVNGVQAVAKLTRMEVQQEIDRIRSRRKNWRIQRELLQAFGLMEVSGKLPNGL